MPLIECRSSTWAPGNAINGKTKEAADGGELAVTSGPVNSIPAPTVIAAPGLAAWQLVLDRPYDDIVAVEVGTIQHALGTFAASTRRQHSMGPCWSFLRTVPSA